MGILDKIHALFKNSYLEETITFEMLQKLPLYKWEGEIKGIKYMKVFDQDGFLIFNTTIKKGSSFGLHQHDCVEWIYVVDGFLKDKKNYWKNMDMQPHDYGLGKSPYAEDPSGTPVWNFRDSPSK